MIKRFVLKIMNSNKSKLNLFEQNRHKANHIFQYKCCSKTWWGSIKNNKCKKCNKEVVKLPLSKMIGIGWFKCQCGRKYAGFCRGDVTSKCHGCQQENLASFIVPGDEAHNKEKSNGNAHHCAMCHGVGNCPIVESVSRIGGIKKNNFYK